MSSFLSLSWPFSPLSPLFPLPPLPPLPPLSPKPPPAHARLFMCAPCLCLCVLILKELSSLFVPRVLACMNLQSDATMLVMYLLKILWPQLGYFVSRGYFLGSDVNERQQEGHHEMFLLSGQTSE